MAPAQGARAGVARAQEARARVAGAQGGRARTVNENSGALEMTPASGAAGWAAGRGRVAIRIRVAAAWAAAWTETEAILQDSKGTSFSSDEVRRDELGLGTCEPARFPSWLAAAAEHPVELRPDAHGNKPSRKEARPTGALAARPVGATCGEQYHVTARRLAAGLIHLRCTCNTNSGASLSTGGLHWLPCPSGTQNERRRTSARDIRWRAARFGKLHRSPP